MFRLDKLRLNWGKNLEIGKKNEQKHLWSPLSLLFFQQNKRTVVFGQLINKITCTTDNTTTKICGIFTLLLFHSQLDPRHSFISFKLASHVKSRSKEQKRMLRKRQRRWGFFHGPEGPMKKSTALCLAIESHKYVNKSHCENLYIEVFIRTSVWWTNSGFCCLFSVCRGDDCCW